MNVRKALLGPVCPLLAWSVATTVTCATQLAAAPSAATPEPTRASIGVADLSGDWIGWVYQDGGGDFPVRVHVAASGGTLHATYDLPHMQVVRAELLASTTGNELQLRATSEPNLGFNFAARDASAEATRLAGVVLLGAEQLGAVELERSPLPLPTVDPATYAALVGAYRLDTGRVVVVDRRAWGEITAFDTQSGRHTTLLPLGTRTFVAGPALYVPGPVSALVEFDDRGLAWHAPGADTERGERVELDHTEIEFESDGASLSGTLVHAVSSAPQPAVVLLGGSDWAERGSLLQDATVWATAGFAAFVYDKRGHGASGGDPVVPFAASASDARAAAVAIATHPRVDGKRIGVSGRSRGGWLATLAATGDGPFAFCITLVGPGISPAAQETTRRLNVMRSAGYDEGDVARAGAYLEEAWRFGRTGTDVERYRRAWLAAKDEPWAEIVDVAEPGTDWSFVRLNMHYDPEPALRGLQVPLLAVFGELDENVVPAENVPVFQRALAGHNDYEIVVLPNANHGLRSVTHAGQRPWSHRATGYVPGRWTQTLDWARARTAR